MQVFKSAAAWLHARLQEYRRTVAVLTLLVGFMPAVLAASWVVRFGVDVPTKDDWDMAAIIVKARTGGLAFADFYEQLAEARMIVPKLIFIASAAGGHWDPRDQMMLSVIICALTAAGIYWLLRRSGIGAAGAAVAFWLSALLIFSPAQFELWVWASGFPSYLPALFLVAALCIVETKFSTAAKFVSCMLLSLAATFTLAHGLLLWGLTFPVLLLDGNVARRMRWLLAWIAVTACCAAFYFYGYVRPPHHPEFAPAVSATAYAQYLLAFFGGELAYAAAHHSNRITLALTTGAVLLVLYSAALAFLAARWRDADFIRRARAWVAIGLYSIGSGLLAALGRVGFGIESALSSRYVTFSLYLSVAVVALAALIMKEVRRSPARPRLFAACAIAAVILCSAYLVAYTLCFPRSVKLMAYTGANTRLSRGAVAFSQVLDTSDVIKRINYPDPAFVRRMALALDELGLLRPRLVRGAELASLNTTVADGRSASGWCDAVVPAHPPMFRASGWAALPGRTKPADCVLLAFESPERGWVAFAMSDTVLKRRDIARLLAREDQLWSGWAATFPRSAVPENAAIGAWAVDIDGPKLYRLNQNAPELKL